MIGHTPGPWAIKFRNDHSAYISLGDPVSGPHKQFDVQFTDLYPSDVADARLIASAPDLLVALKDLAEAVESMQATFGCIQGGHPEEDDMHFHEKWAEEFLKERMEPVRAAIAKAEGNQA
jgi:hypothetical protein